MHGTGKQVRWRRAQEPAETVVFPSMSARPVTKPAKGMERSGNLLRSGKKSQSVNCFLHKHKELSLIPKAQ